MALSASRLVSVTSFKVNMFRWALIPAVAAALSTVFSNSMLKTASSIKSAPELVLAVLTMVIFYYFLLRIFRCITKSDISFAKRILKK
jgi:hypothetical protein